MLSFARPLALLFDLDGTLIDSEASICDAASAAFNIFNQKVHPADIANHLGAPLVELYQLFHLQLSPEEIELNNNPTFILETNDFKRYLKAFLLEHDKHPENRPEPLPGVIAGLQEIASFGIPMAVATTKPTHRAEPHLKTGPLAGFFQHIQGTDDGMKAKPAPDCLQAACHALNVDPTRTWMLGDTQRDISAALAIGARPLAIAYSDARAARASQMGADKILRSLEEFSALLT